MVQTSPGTQKSDLEGLVYFWGVNWTSNSRSSTGKDHSLGLEFSEVSLVFAERRYTASVVLRKDPKDKCSKSK